jgi:16S rRNA (uracil1498-N3)-methyltransferase
VPHPRFFVDTVLAAGATIDLPANVAHHASHVLRLHDGDSVVVFNGQSGEFRGRLTSRASRAELVAHDTVERESSAATTLVQAWIATDKLEWVVEKAVELGVARIVLAPCRRSVVQVQGERRAKRIERLRDIVVAACCQSGRNRVPTIDAPDDLATALSLAAKGTMAVVLQPDGSRSLVDVIDSGGDSFAIAVGPEGGFDANELALAERTGYLSVRLGPRILRTETAGLAALSTVQALGGDFR